MSTRSLSRMLFVWFALPVVASALAPFGALAAPPVVKTVPWVAANPLIPHDTWSGKSITLKGTADVQGANIAYAWDFGDGSAVFTGTVGNRFAIQATHAYTGAVGTVFTARLTVENTTTGESASRPYYVTMQERSLPVEVNVAIDEGLWYLHKSQLRFTDAGLDKGDWTSGCSAVCSSFYGLSASNVNAFEVNGHLENGHPDNPYTETVARGMRRLFDFLYTVTIPSSQTNGLGTFNPDANGNLYGVFVNQSYPYYQGGMFMDAIVASGTPGAIVTTGEAPAGGDPGIRGRTYASIVQDMADAYGYCQYDLSGGGGWRYNCNQWPDNSAAQWGAIGLIAAEREWGALVPQIVKSWNRQWLLYTQAGGGYYDGAFGYDQPNYYPWGPYADTASGLVQLAMDGIGRGTDPHPTLPNPSWDRAERFIRDNFGNAGGPTTNIKGYYYALFSFTKAMLLHDSNGDGVAERLELLQSSTPGVPPIDWYAAEVAKGAPTDGVARTLVNQQSTAGYWYGHNYEATQFLFETAQAIIMLNRTVFSSGVPVAVAKATPNPAVAGQLIMIDGSDSFHQDAGKSIDSWEWDLDNDGVFEASGPFPIRSFPAVGDYPVRLRVTDSGSPELSAETVLIVRITIPPLAPTANAGGPYNFCIGRSWFLDGSGSVNPDEGQSEPGSPADTIAGGFAWDLDGDAHYDDAVGAFPSVTNFWGVGAYNISLRVTDTTAISFPSSNMGNLSDTDTAQVFVRTATDPACVCISNLAARPKLRKAQLTWTYAATHHFNIYRGTVSGGPYLKIGATTSTYSTFLDPGPLTVGTTYYYVVRMAAANDNEICQSPEVSARPTLR